MSDTVEQIKSRLDIVDVVSGYLKVAKSGANWKARCPFHNEKTPSFYISPERQSWHCFGCNKGGDMFSFVQEIDGIEFVEALRILATRAGVEMAQYRPEDSAARVQRQRLLAVAELSAKFFEKQLWHGAAGAKALTYLRDRGLKDETIKAWRLGWAPNDWRALTSFLQSGGHEASDIVAAGMAVQKEATSYKLQARLYDRFRSRIMFPICDGNGQVVGFTGRVFGAEVAVDGEVPAKYVNTPQTAIYDKSRILFGLDKAKLEMRKRDTALLVEGNMDAIMAWQAGVQNVAATSGTALTPHQLRMLARYSANLDFCFDTDQAGQTATRRGIGLALAQNFNVRVLTIADPDCKDPADYVAKYGEKFQEVASSAKPVMQYYYDAVVTSYDPSSSVSKRSIVSALGPLIRHLTSHVEKSHWIGQLAMLLRTDQASVEHDIAAVRDDISISEREEAGPEVAPIPADATVDPLSFELLAILTRAPELSVQAADSADMLDARVARIIREPAALADKNDRDGQLITKASLHGDEYYRSFSPAELSAQAAELTTRMRLRSIRARQSELMLRIAAAEQKKDLPLRNELVGQFDQLNLERNRLQSIQSPNHIQ